MIKQIETFKLVPHPNNPRKGLGDLTELTDSIRTNGIFQNLTVVETGTADVYTVVIGHRRLAAAMLAGLETVPCAVVEMDEKKQASTMLLENMQRSDLTPYEQAQGIQICLDLGMTEEDISGKTGFSRSTVRRRLQILELDSNKVKDAQGSIEEYIALEEIKDVEVRNGLLKHMGTNNFNLEVAKAKEKQEVVQEPTEISDKTEVPEIEKTKGDVALFVKLRKNFMTEVFKRKISREELAQSVMIPSVLGIEKNFKFSGNKDLFHQITNPNALSEDKLIERSMNHRINFFVITVYCLLENKNDLVNLYKHLEVFGYEMSDEEKEHLENDEN